MIHGNRCANLWSRIAVHASIIWAFVESQNHLSVPYTAELQFEPAANKNSSIILAVGGALNWTRESLTLQVATQIDSGIIRNFPLGLTDRGIDPDPQALAAVTQFNSTKFHLGYVLRAGFRTKLTEGPQP